MQVSEITFNLANTSPDTDVMAVLIPAQLRRNGLLDKKFLKSGTFKDETGTIDINASQIAPDGALSELDEYVSQLTGVKVLSISIATNNLTQATQNFVQKNYIPYKPAESQNLDTKATLVVGESAVLHTFVSPFTSGAMNSLEMKLLKGENVTVKMSVSMPDFGNSSLPPLS